MLDEKKTVRSYPSLPPLRVALPLAKSGVPPRPPLTTFDEHRALDLIERMKTEYDRPLPFACWRYETDSNIFNLQEVIGLYV